jgi:hypothetical protein
MTTKTFPTADVIGAYSTIVLSSFDRICLVANHVTGQQLMVTQVGTEHPTYSAILAKQHPFLTTLDVPSKDKGNFNHFTVNAWLADVCDKYGEVLEITTDPTYPKLNHMDGVPDRLLPKTFVLGVPENDA